MKLRHLIKEIDFQEIRGSKEIEITGICNDSRKAAPGNLFIARKGYAFDGNEFLAEAASAGVNAIVTDIYNPFFEGITQLLHSDPSAVEGMLAARYYDFPSEDLFVIGITGTNGKTTTSYLVRHLLESKGKSTGLIGTVEYIAGSNRMISSHTTPDALMTQKFLREMLIQKNEAVSMEISSHGLVQGRVDRVAFDIAIFTNLTLDHLDYHKTMGQYAEAKKKLFVELLQEKRGKRPFAIVNNDSSWTSFMVDGTQAEILTYGIHPSAKVCADSLKLSQKGMEFWVSYKEERKHFSSPLIGRYNAYNLLAAISVGLTSSFSLEELSEVFRNFSQIPGRLERVENDQGLSIFVDYAHTPDGLFNVLSTLKEITEGKVIVVFGCGGDRDRSKRSQMGEISHRLSDFSIITSDNPRSEDPQEICKEILQGIPSSSSRYLVEIDRKKAIEKAIQMADKKDMILLAGKGHENYQVFANCTLSFDDRQVVREML